MSPIGNLIISDDNGLKLNIPELDTTKKCFVVSIVGEKSSGKSTFINGLISYIAKENVNIFDATTKTPGINYLIIPLGDLSLILLDYEGSTFDETILRIVYSISNLIIFNARNITCEMNLSSIPSALECFDKIGKPNLIIHNVGNIMCELHDVNRSVGFIKRQKENSFYPVRYRDILKYFSSLDYVVTNSLGVKEKKLLQEGNYTEIINDDVYGFGKSYKFIVDKIKSNVDFSFSSTEITNNLEDISEYINTERVQKYNEKVTEFYKVSNIRFYEEKQYKLEILRGFFSNVLNTYRLLQSHEVFSKYTEEFKVNNADPRIIEINNTIMEKQSELVNNLEKKIYDELLNENKNTNKQLQSLIDEYIFKPMTSKFMACAKNYEKDDPEEGMNDIIDKLVEEKITNLLSPKIRLELLVESINKQLNFKILEQSNLYDQIENKIREFLVDESIEKYINKKIVSLKKFDRDFDYLLQNWMAEIQNLLLRELENIHMYVINQVNYDFVSNQLVISFSEDDSGITIKSSCIEEFIKEKVDNINSKKQYYKEIYSKYITQEYKGPVSQIMIQNHRDIIFAKLDFSCLSNDEFEIVVKTIDKNNTYFSGYIRSIVDGKSIIHVGVNIEDMLCRLCNFIRIKNTFVRDKFTKNAYFLNSNFCHIYVDVNDPEQRIFLNKIYNKYFENKWSTYDKFPINGYDGNNYYFSEFILGKKPDETNNTEEKKHNSIWDSSLLSYVSGL